MSEDAKKPLKLSEQQSFKDIQMLIAQWEEFRPEGEEEPLILTKCREWLEVTEKQERLHEEISRLLDQGKL